MPALVHRVVVTDLRPTRTAPSKRHKTSRPKELDPDDRTDAMIIATCANALAGNPNPPEHAEVAIMMASPTEIPDVPRVCDAAKQHWNRHCVNEIEGLMGLAGVAHPEGDAFRPFAALWLVDAGLVTEENFALCLSRDRTQVEIHPSYWGSVPTGRQRVKTL